MTEPKPKLDRGRGSAKPETDDAMTSDLLKTAEKPQRTPAKSGAKSAKTGTGRPGKREQTKLNNEQAILGAAREVFAELGYGATTVRDIIRRTGLASGTFYNYFKSKEEVFEALMDEGMMRIRPRLEEARKRSNTFEEFIRNAYKAYFTYLADDLDHYRVIRRNSGALRVRMDTPVTMQGFEEIKAYIEDDIRDCERKGDFGAEFIRLARAVYVTNDKRAALKKEINLLLGSTIVEEKSYAEY